MAPVFLLPLAATTLLSTPAYPNNAYDPVSARAYFTRRPLQVAGRALEIGWKSAGFASSLAADALAGNDVAATRAEQRGAELTDLLCTLGPTFIKIGQSASVRTDLLPPVYVRALTALQEDVPPFSSSEAREIIADELGATHPLLNGLSAEPLAAASLGQVYRGTYEGKAVAVKVQRPQIAERIALDMFLVRELAAPIASAIGAPGDVVGIADAWGAGLVAELDYSEEARNAEAFNEDVAGGPLEGRVFAPRVLREASAARVLTTEWVEGDRLDRTAAKDDVPRLASLAMNSYMNMMLETGTLHCDPHPGNLLRTPDGRLCILDWGLVTTLEPNLQLTLIEHVAHLTARDYAAIPNDLVRLGFVPEGGEDAAKEAGVVALLTKAYSKRAEGGGFANFDVVGLLSELQTLAADAGGSLFQIPPYFAYIAKAFATLEGIGLSVDPSYSIINETLPYLSRRILTDPSPRTAGSLRTFVFGADKDDLEARVLDAERVSSLIDGVQRYAASAAVSADEGALVPLDRAGRAERAADVLLDVLREDTPASRLVSEQLVLVLGASSRTLFAEARSRSGTLPLVDGRLPTSARRSRLGALLDPLGLFQSSALVTPDARDRSALDAVAQLAAAAAALLGEAEGAAAPTEDELRSLASVLVRKAWERREDLQVVSRRLVAEALDQTVSRMSRPTSNQLV